MIENLDILKEKIAQSNKIVFFGGAGVSTESGIPDFRGAEGIYKKSPEEILSHTYFMENTGRFYEFYKKHLIYENIKPNITHQVLADWEKQGKLMSIITQNIDGLHQLAGNKKVWELHGSIHRNFCIDCNKPYSLQYIIDSQNIPLCSCGGIIKPDVVLYEEGLDSQVLSGAIHDLENADLCIVGGTSLKVYPAAGLLRYFRQPDNLIVINKGETFIDKQASLVFDEKLGKIFEELQIEH